MAGLKLQRQRARSLRPAGVAARRGFTLVEMLIVAALISLFAGLAVINIQAQLNLNKQKAAIAECREIATAESFAYNDTGFFPKFCFLKFDPSSLVSELNNQLSGATGNPQAPIGLDALDYYGYPVANVIAIVDPSKHSETKWASAYMTNNNGRLCDMQFDSFQFDANGNPTAKVATIHEKWPTDPWGVPYVAYLLHTGESTSPNGLDGKPRPARFIRSATEPANYFAGVVSYGRNRVPGLGDDPKDSLVTGRLGLRLFDDVGPNSYKLRPLSELQESSPIAGQRLDMFLPSTVGWSDSQPKSQDVGSDDRVYQF